MGSILSLVGTELVCWHGVLSITYLADVRVTESAEAAAAPSLLQNEVSSRSHLPWLEMSPWLLPWPVGRCALPWCRHVPWGYAAGAKAGARLREGDGDTGWGSAASLPRC